MGAAGIDLDVAAHEGGHVCVAWLLCLNPTRATIEPSLGFDGKVTLRATTSEMDREQAFDHAVVSMAGNAAEALLGGLVGGGENDLAQARAFLHPFCRSETEVDDMIDDARRAARRLLRSHADALIAVSIALLSERTLDREQINKIMSPPDDDEDDGEMTLAEFMAGRGGEASRAMSPRLVKYRGL